jgi:uncharacterized Zn-finger protein
VRGGGGLNPRFLGGSADASGVCSLITLSPHLPVRLARFTGPPPVYRLSPQYRFRGDVGIRSAAIILMESSAQQPQQQLQPKTPGPGLFQCTTCQRTFTRIDHLARHVRSRESWTQGLYREHSVVPNYDATDLQERPFQCQECGKAFGRPYVLSSNAETPYLTAPIP